LLEAETREPFTASHSHVKSTLTPRCAAAMRDATKAERRDKRCPVRFAASGRIVGDTYKVARSFRRRLAPPAENYLRVIRSEPKRFRNRWHFRQKSERSGKDANFGWCWNASQCAWSVLLVGRTRDRVCSVKLGCRYQRGKLMAENKTKPTTLSVPAFL
jgi:hypothetical protein